MLEVELLAPARDLEIGTAAIDCGADSVYIAAPKYGARSRRATVLTISKVFVLTPTNTGLKSI